MGFFSQELFSDAENVNYIKFEKCRLSYILWFFILKILWFEFFIKPNYYLIPTNKQYRKIKHKKFNQNKILIYFFNRNYVYKTFISTQIGYIKIFITIIHVGSLKFSFITNSISYDRRKTNFPHRKQFREARTTKSRRKTITYSQWACSA